MGEKKRYFYNLSSPPSIFPPFSPYYKKSGENRANQKEFFVLF